MNRIGTDLQADHLKSLPERETGFTIGHGNGGSRFERLLAQTSSPIYRSFCCVPRTSAKNFSYAHINVVLQRSEEHTSELQSLMRISYAVFCLKKKNINSDVILTRKIPHINNSL